MSAVDAEKLEALVAGQELRCAGAALDVARRFVVTLHGRGATAEDILTLSDALALPRIAYLAPQAAGGAWYPRPFTAPLEANEPWLSAALGRVDAIVLGLRGAGVAASDIALMGFSQGACLSLEYAARNPVAVAAVVGFSGGLIGPDVAGRRDEGSLKSLRAFLGCGEQDPYIPAARVRASAEHLRALGAEVAVRLYPGATHTIRDDEIAEARRILAER